MDRPTEHSGTTVSASPDGQHKLLTALRTELTEFPGEFNAFRDATNRRLTALEHAMGQVLYGLTEIKRLLAPS